MAFDIHIYILFLFSAISIFFFVFGLIQGRQEKNSIGIILSLIGGLLWISVWSLADNIEVGHVEAIDTKLVYQMNQTTGTATHVLSNTIWSVVERPVNINSVLYDVRISCISMNMVRTGSPTGIATIGVLNDGQTFIKIFGTINVTTIQTIGERTYRFCLSNHDYYIITDNQDRIGIFYNGGSAGNTIGVYRSSTDVFDGTNSVSSTMSNTGVWTDSTTTDMKFVLTYEDINITGKAKNYSLGAEDNANFYIKIYMLTFGVMMIFVGAFQGRLGN